MTNSKKSFVRSTSPRNFVCATHYRCEDDLREAEGHVEAAFTSINIQPPSPCALEIEPASPCDSLTGGQAAFGASPLGTFSFPGPGGNLDGQQAERRGRLAPLTLQHQLSWEPGSATSPMRIPTPSNQGQFLRTPSTSAGGNRWMWKSVDASKAAGGSSLALPTGYYWPRLVDICILDGVSTMTLAQFMCSTKSCT